MATELPRQVVAPVVKTVNQLSKQGIELRSIKENIDSTAPTNKLMFHIVEAMTKFERDII